MYLNYFSNGDVDVGQGGGNLIYHNNLSGPSDDRLKHNEVDISGALHILKQLTPQKYFKTTKPHEVHNNFAVDSSGNYVIKKYKTKFK